MGAVNRVAQFSNPDDAPVVVVQQRLARRNPGIWAGGVLALGSSLALMLWYWPGAIPLDVASGVWTALAKDFADGRFYRPVFDGMAYGGTRYMPVFFMLHGALIRWSLDPVSAGLVLTVASVVAFDVAMYFALRALAVRRGIAVPLAVMGHATVAFQLLTLNVKADLLAAALNLSTFTLALHYFRKPDRRVLLALTIVPVLAILTRLPSVSGLVFALWLIYRQSGWKNACRYAAMVTVLLVTCCLALYFASQGRVLSSFLSVADGGGGLAFAFWFPWWFVLAAVQDPFFVLLFATAVWCVARSGEMTDPSRQYLVIAGLLTLPLFVSRGIDNNHLLDLLAASILVIGFELSAASAGSAPARAVPLVVGLLNLVMWIPGVFSVRSAIENEGRPSRQEIASIASLTRSDGAPMLTENPIVSVLAGERPVVADPFSLRILANDRTDIRNAFSRQLGSESFDAVVLVDWSGAPKDSVFQELRSRTDVGPVRFYGDVHFPPETLDLLARHYQVSAVTHPFVILTPRRAPPGSLATASHARS